MKANQALFRMVTMARVLGVSRSGYYAWLHREPSERSQEDARIGARLVALHKASHGIYGAPRLVEDLRDESIHVGRKRVARLMNKHGIRGVCRRKRAFVPKTTIQDEGAKPSEDLVQRRFEATAPNALWVADITYVPTRKGFLYLAVVLDVFSRKIVGWAMHDTLHTEVVLAALQMAVDTRKPEQVIHHSDHGCQYTSLTFGKRCKDHSIRRSMGTVGDCYDNAMAESFFASLECEWLDRNDFIDKNHARRKLFEYIEGFYNPLRRHSAIGYLSPNNFEEINNTQRAAA